MEIINKGKRPETSVKRYIRITDIKKVKFVYTLAVEVK